MLSNFFSVFLTGFASLIFSQSLAINVSCDFSEARGTTHGPLKKPYQCKAKSLSVSGHQKVEKVSGGHERGKTNDDVKLINLKEISTERLPGDFQKHFKNLEGIFAFSMGLTKLVKEDLSSYPKLTYVDFSSNKIVTLPSNLFEGNLKLEWIDFSSNYLQQIGVKLLDPLTKLNYADFESNRCIDYRAWDKTNIERELKKELKAIKCALHDAWGRMRRLLIFHWKFWKFYKFIAKLNLNQITFLNENI